MIAKLPIATRFSLTLVVAILANTALILYFAQHDADRELREEIGRYLAETAQQFSERLDKDMWTRSRELDVLRQVNVFNFSDDIPEIQRAIDALSQAIPSFSWIGFTDPHGLVLASTGRILAGGSLAARPVFTQALDKPFVGDVHDAVLLAKLLPNPTGEAMKFVDLSSPVRDAQGRFLGVLAAHLSWLWVREIEQAYFAPLYEKAGIETLIVSADGVVLLGPPGLLGTRVVLPLLGEARARSPLFRTTRWSDGREYVVGAAYGDGYREYPGLGWTVLVRQPTEVAFAKVRRLRATILGVGLLAALGAMAVAVLVSRHLTSPLRAIVSASDRLARGEIENIPPYFGIPDIEILTKALRNLVDNLKNTTREKDRMEEMAFLDRLTALPNRAAFQRDIQAAAGRAPRKNRAVGILYLDLDDFKPVNDVLGHAAGDIVLQAVAIRLRGSLRQGDAAYRLGGDEFVAMLTVEADVASEDLAAAAARIIEAVNLPLAAGGGTVRVGCSVGGSVWPADSMSIDEVVCFADAALYASKRAGKNVFTRHRALAGEDEGMGG
ncbi:MAG: diguanylate cyclase (GGDEF) domain-containing protein [Solidesulfovibrio magneticus str. Maddingley MBC34]|uniref:Diguanylate cyclase (GGDEF) domain-containing protein n=1 Tax=Solidesulfovibrio magneticus str. Maddingley MBC34 TaxID=1206767 RepID=K6FGX7_9BACT|nr:MAG: diguanylate cyclase (GGDEF) domain-containing protein [Solidesulfovibrio magneticus str. Maddingley MBC34]